MPRPSPAIPTGCHICYRKWERKCWQEKSKSENRTTYRCGLLLAVLLSLSVGLCFKNRAGFYKPQNCQNVLRPDCCGCFCNCYVIILITLTMFCSSLVYDGFSCLSGEELCLSWLLHCSYPVHSPLCVAGTQITDGMNEHSLTVLEKRRSCNLLLCSLLPLPSRDKVVSVSAAWGALKAGSFCLLGLRI